MSWLKTLATVAPVVASALGGPLAGMAVKWLQMPWVLITQRAH